MRQVPHYAIIGNGRMAKHIRHYFDFLKLNYHSWSRNNNDHNELHDVLSSSSHALLLINDDAIDNFILTHIKNRYPHLLITHFSGCLISNFAYSAHPLQTFTEELYSFEDYKKIPFMVDDNAPSFSELLPGLNNPNYKIKKEEKAYYHALCVLANNFSTLLWHKFQTEMQNRFQVDPFDLAPYLKQTFKNIQNNSSQALTGPIQRKDTKTLMINLNALKDDEYYEIFKAFIDQFVFKEKP